MSRVAALSRYVAPCAQPLSTFAISRLSRRITTAKNLNLVTLKGPCTCPLRFTVPFLKRRLSTLRQTRSMANLLPPTAVHADEADSGGKDAVALLPRLNGARGKGAAVADALNVVQNRRL